MSVRERAEDPQDQRLQLVVLHVYRQRRARARHLREQGLEARQHALLGASGIQRIEARRER